MEQHRFLVKMKAQPLHTTETKGKYSFFVSCALPEAHEHMPAIGKVLEDGYGLEA